MSTVVQLVTIRELKLWQCDRELYLVASIGPAHKLVRRQGFPMIISSSDDRVHLHALFPTLIYQANLEQHETYKADFASVFRKYRFDAQVNDETSQPAGEYHGKILLHHEESVQPFFRELASQVSSYLQVLGMRTEVFDVQVLKSWFVICKPDEEKDDAIRAHNHSCSDISFCYYVDVPTECPPINFHMDQRLRTAFFDSSFHHDAADGSKSSVTDFNWWNSDAWSIQPSEGDLVFFPGHQLHSVDANETEKTRISIAGDLALTLREPYRNLEFGRTSQKHWKGFSLDDVPRDVQFDEDEEEVLIEV